MKLEREGARSRALRLDMGYQPFHVVGPHCLNDLFARQLLMIVDMSNKVGEAVRTI
jgi:hypothetical protein